MRLIDADALIQEWYRINNITEDDRGARFIGYTEIPRFIANAPTIDAPKVAYICDGRKCECDCSECFRTTDVEHARDFKLMGDTYFQQPSAEAVHGWRTGEPTENGEYMVTLDAWGHRYIDIMHYDKPQMPNREIDGACWYRSDDEWGDVVYDDKDIIAWMPLPTPYKGGDDNDKE